MIKKVKFLISMFVLFSIMATMAWSQEQDYGLGIILGEPTGFSGKMWRTDKVAFGGAVAWSFTNDPSFHAHGDILWHNWNILKDAFDVDSGRIPLYYGIGVKFKAEDDTRLGTRFVLGASYMFEDAPFDIFLEIAPVMNISPETEARINAAVGTRFWF